jgi:hypothetical protein
MARQRKKQDGQAEGFVCPECGRTFIRAAALGAHRRRVHDVVGSSNRSRARARAEGSRSRNGSAGRRRTRTSRGGRSGASETRPAEAAGLDRDALLQALFPAGIPAKESVLQSVNRWLEEAERLARMG